MFESDAVKEMEKKFKSEKHRERREKATFNLFIKGDMAIAERIVYFILFLVLSFVTFGLYPFYFFIAYRYEEMELLRDSRRHLQTIAEQGRSELQDDPID